MKASLLLCLGLVLVSMSGSLASPGPMFEDLVIFAEILAKWQPGVFHGATPSMVAEGFTMARSTLDLPTYVNVDLTLVKEVLGDLNDGNKPSHLSQDSFNEAQRILQELMGNGFKF